MRTVPIDNDEFKITVDRRVGYMLPNVIGRLILLTEKDV